MKHTQRLDDARLAEILHERGMAELESIREILALGQQGGPAFAESMVNAHLVGDWDLSRVVCELFNLPFLPVDSLEIDPKLAASMDVAFLRQHALVPISRYGQVLVVALPGLVPANVLGMLSAQTDLAILPVVGTVESNRRWIQQHLPVETAAPIAPAQQETVAAQEWSGGDVAPAMEVEAGAGGEWGDLFDQADAAVQMDLGGEGLSMQDLEKELGDLDIDSLIVEQDPTLDEDAGDPASSPAIDPAGGSGELPPMPSFGAE